MYVVGAFMSRRNWNGAGRTTVKNATAAAEVAGLCLVNALSNANVIPLEQYRGLRYLRRNGFDVKR